MVAHLPHSSKQSAEGPSRSSRRDASAAPAAADASAVAPTIEGWLSEAQGRALLEAAAAATGRGAIVEIGSWKGRSTIWLAAGARLSGQRIFAIDPHAGSREDPDARTLAAFMANLQRAGVSDIVEPLVMSSAEAADRLPTPIEVLFVDGDHAYDAVVRDADLWLPRLVDGGVVLFHDVATAGYSGPRRVFRHRICWNRSFDSVARVGSMMSARRTSRRGISAAVWGTTAGLLLYLYDARRIVRRLTRPRGSASRTPTAPNPTLNSR